MSADFYYTLGDTASILEETFTDADGVAVDLTGATVLLYLRHMATERLVGPLTMSLTTPASGVVSYRFLGTELVGADDNPLPGGWWYQCKATLDSGRVLHIPNDRGRWKMLDASPAVEA